MATRLDPEMSKKLEEFRQKVSATAEDIVFRVFPTKIIELNLAIESTLSSDSPFHLSRAAPSTDATVYPPPTTSEELTSKKRKLNGGSGSTQSNDTRNAVYPNLMLSNQHIVKIHADIKKECEQLADLVDKVKLWVNLTMPKIEDGDNFGVSIQEEALNELVRSQESAYNLRDGARADHLTRAKICSKLIKYPHVEDYALSLKEHDEKQLYLAKQHLVDIRNIYAVITDILHKNINKIRAPKANNGVGLY